MGATASRRAFDVRARVVIAGISAALAAGIALVVSTTVGARGAPSHVSTSVHAPRPHATTGAS
jgi:hypothetical protein